MQEISLLKKIRNNSSFKIFNIGARIKSTGYYKDKFKAADAVIIAEGALKYSLQDFSYYFEIINRIATKKNIPVMLNAMSIEKANNGDFRYHQLCRAVNMPSIKLITTRDGVEGVSLLKRDYIGDKKRCDYVGDTAFWIPECYNIHKKNGEVYGIGVMDPHVFVQNGFDVSAENVERFYMDMINELNSNKINYRIFTNGLDGDYDFACKLVNEMHLPQETLLPNPKSPSEFIELISGFKAIIGARMHACITAFSLGVPLVGLYWHDKVKKFAKTMYLEENFFGCDDLNANLLVRRMLETRYSDKSLCQREKYKEKTKEYIFDFIKENVIR